MPVFLIVSEEENNPLQRRIVESFPEDHYILSKNQWLVDAEKTTEEVAETLDIWSAGAGAAVVFGVESHSGYHRKSLWEWLKLE